MNYEQAKQMIQILRNDTDKASQRLKSFPKGPMGLTPDSVKSSPDYIIAKANYDMAFNAERNLNGFMVKNFKHEMKRDRMLKKMGYPNLSVV